MKKIQFILLSCVGLISGCGNPKAQLAEKTSTYAESNSRLLELEKSAPASYLTVNSKMRRDEKMITASVIFTEAEYVPDGNTIYGSIKNSASLAKFKDVLLSITFFSVTHQAIQTSGYTIYQYFPPASQNDFELKVYPPEGTAGFAITVIGADMD